MPESQTPTQTAAEPVAPVDPIRQGLHEAGWYARADLDPRLVDGLVADVLDLVREQLTSRPLVRHIENFVPLGFSPDRDPYANVTEAAAGILTETAANLTLAAPSDADLIDRSFPDRSAGRWCATCEQHGTHHTDKHEEFLAAAREDFYGV